MFANDIGDCDATGLGEFFEGDAFFAGEGDFHDLAAGGVDFEVTGFGVREADAGVVGLLGARLRFKANLLFAGFFLEVLEFALGFVVGTLVGGSLAEEEAELAGVDVGGIFGGAEEIFLESAGALFEPVGRARLRVATGTVLLDRMRLDAEEAGNYTLRIEAPENRSLPALIAPSLRLALLKLSKVESAKDYAQRGLRALAGFAKALKIKYADIEVGLDLESEAGLADNGDLEGDLSALLEEVGRAAQKAKTAVVLFVDELQYLKEDQFAALISALHRCAQSRLPLTMVGAGLPQLRGLAGNAKSYAERLFDFPMIGPLPDAEAARAIVKPAEDEGVTLKARAVARIVSATHGYPYFLQEWGKHTWDVAKKSPITLADVERASVLAVAALDESFFRVRFDRLTPAEKRYLRAMAELGSGPHRSGDIASELGKAVNSFAPMRQSLIGKGMIWSPSHGDTAFTSPLFDEFMKRIMPGSEWRAGS